MKISYVLLTKDKYGYITYGYIWVHMDEDSLTKDSLTKDTNYEDWLCIEIIVWQCIAKNILQQRAIVIQYPLRVRWTGQKLRKMMSRNCLNP